jgi:hypothetical protein
MKYTACCGEKTEVTQHVLTMQYIFVLPTHAHIYKSIYRSILLHGFAFGNTGFIRLIAKSKII